jgi:hypothetical protein
VSACTGSSRTATSPESAEVSPDDFGNWMMVYYRKPEPDAVPAAAAHAIEQRLFDGEHAPSNMGFMAGYLRDNPDKLEDTLAALNKLPESDRQYTLAAAWLAAAPGSREAASRLARLNDGGRRLLDRANDAGIRPGDQVAPLSAYALDYMWGLFFATGDANAVLPMVALLGVPRNSDGDVMAMMTAAAAEWSLGSLAKQHKVIRDFCAAQIPLQPPTIAARLKTIVEQADAQ